MVKKYNDKQMDQDDESTGGEGGQSDTGTGASGVAFHLDFLTGERRDDLLSSEELKRRLIVHNDILYDLVKKQKIERKTRLEIKEGKRPTVSNAYPGGTGYGMGDNKVEKHPVTEKAYFSGIDKKVIGVLSESENIANEDKKNKFEQTLELKNRLQHTHTPKFNPTPRPS
jgi:hypothetical protein